MITIIDYGVGNLRSVQKAFEKAGAGQVLISGRIEDIKAADKVVLPGVGAIRSAMDRLKELNLVKPISEIVTSGKPFFGICVGFQLLFEKSFEFGETEGLGLIRGSVQKFPKGVKIPQIGWNSLHLKNNALWNGIRNDEDVYFCHSFYAKPEDSSVIAATTDYGIEYCSAVCKDNVFGVQFHPEKSQTAGLKILSNFINMGAK
ncbi:MAG: imidazole glycerol phosphate synthase subunit HisH [Candidatus Omnitrophota bacterium]